MYSLGINDLSQLFFSSVDHFGVGVTDMLEGIRNIFSESRFRVGAEHLKKRHRFHRFEGHDRRARREDIPLLGISFLPREGALSN
jgi:hypothetical protein